MRGFPSPVVAGFCLILIPAFGWSQNEPAKLATSARFDLAAESPDGVIDEGQLVNGDGTIQRQNWLPEARQASGYTVNLAVSPIGWSAFRVRFTPRFTGKVELRLMGPWEQASQGVLYRQEILWDDFQVEGGSIANGGFESGETGWQGDGRRVASQTADVKAVAGTHYARTWHNQTLATMLKVSQGKPVAISGHARAVRPEGYREMKRVTRTDTPAHQAVKKFLHGANLGNDLEVPPGQNWNVNYTTADIRHIRKEGFDHIRIPIGWHHYTGPGPEYRLKPEIFQKVDTLVKPALDEGLNVLINIHHFDDFTTDPSGQSQKFYAIWRQVSEHYAKAPAGLAFELLNEPKDAATTEVVNPIFAEAIRQIRKTNPNRTLFVGPGRWNSIDELPNLRLPENDLNLIVTVHCYDPFNFTHQGADWTGDSADRRLTGIVFPGPPRQPLVPDSKLKLSSGFRGWLKDYNSLPAEANPSSPLVIDKAVKKAKDWSEYYGRPMHLGEFGAFTTADPASRAHYYQAFRERLEKADIGWAIWDWRAGFRYWNEKANQPEPGMREALFGTSRTPARR